MMISAGPREGRVVGRTRRQCPLCGCSETYRWKSIPAKRDLTGGCLELATCFECRLVYQPWVVEREALSRAYDYMGASSVHAMAPELRQRRLGRILSRLEPYRKSGRLVEVGCGNGFLVRAALERGWDVFATEISSSCCQALLPMLGQRLHRGELANAGFEGGSFDAVVMLEVIEHLPEPRSYLLAARRLLREGGALFLTTPNFGGFSRRLWGTGWRVVGDEHLNYFDRNSMRRLLASSGLLPLDVMTSGLDLSAIQQLWPGGRSVGANDEPPIGANDEPRAKRRSAEPLAQLRGMLTDGVVEAVNATLNAFLLGDTLRVLAIRTEATEEERPSMA